MTPVSSDVIHSTPLRKCPICKEIYIETDIEARVDVFLEKTSCVSYSSFTSFVKRKIFPRKNKNVFNPFIHNAVKWPNILLKSCRVGYS